MCSCHVGRAQTISAFLLYSGVTRGFKEGSGSEKGSQLCIFTRQTRSDLTSFLLCVGRVEFMCRLMLGKWSRNLVQEKIIPIITYGIARVFKVCFL